MAVNETRSMNAELAEGRTDGVVRKIAMDRSGEVNRGTLDARQTLLSDNGYGPMDRSFLDDPTRHRHGDENIAR